MSESQKSKKKFLLLLSRLTKEIGIDSDFDDLLLILADNLNKDVSGESFDLLFEFASRIYKKVKDNNTAHTKLSNALQDENDDLQEAYDKLSASEEKYRLIFNNMLSGLSYQKIILNDEGEPIDYVFLEINNSFKKMFNLKQDDIIGRRASEICPYLRKDNFNWMTAFGNVALQKTPSFKLDRYLKSFGKWYSIFSFSPKYKHFVTIYEDVTERKQYNKKLIKVTNKLMEWNKDFKSFVYATSHDLKEPIRIISNYIEMLEDEYISKYNDDNEEANVYVNVIKNSVNKLSSQISNLGDYFDVGNFENEISKKISFREVNIYTVIEEAIRILSDEIKQSKAKITIDKKKMPKINMHPLQIKLVFINLIDNALIFADESRLPEIFITMQKDKGGWRFSVKDNGIGIPNEYFDKIFGIFKTLKRKEHKGSGLGLAICKKIVKNHNGEIWVRSTVDEGSTFYFTIKT